MAVLLFFLRVVAAACGSIASILILVRLRPLKAARPPAHRLQPLDLAAAALLFFVLRYLGAWWLARGRPADAVPLDPADPRVLGMTAVLLVLVLLFLRWRSGPTGWYPAARDTAVQAPLATAEAAAELGEVPEAPSLEPGEEKQPAPPVLRAGPKWTVRVYLAVLPGLAGVAWFNLWLVETLTGRPAVHHILRGFDALTPIAQIQTALLAVLVMPVLEEMLFRGFLFRALARHRAYGPARALVFSSVVFALAHGPVMWLPSLILGGLFAWIDHHTGNLRLAMLVHALHNAAVLLLVPLLPVIMLP